LGAIPSVGGVHRYAATATLALHGVSRAVRFTISAERAGTSIDLLADITIPFGEWSISVQGVPFLADIQSPAVAEVLLDLTQGTGNQASAIGG
jgi:polyisoprenoid-binding protein YceI